MSKYIRTKDGRIMEIHLEEMSLPATIGVHTEECVEGEYIGVEVIKQADTIEDLCDEEDKYKQVGDSITLVKSCRKRDCHYDKEILLACMVRSRVNKTNLEIIKEVLL